MPSEKLRELATLLQMTAMQHGQTADIMREVVEGGEVVADSLDELAERLDEISNNIIEGVYDS
jgi:hypothetical protein